MKLRVGIDVGGTFTDVTVFDEDQGELVAVRKYVSNPAQPAAVMETITADLARDFGADAVTLILHGSTAALNTLLEGKGVRTGLLTTRGFRDVYEIGRQWRGEDVFNIFAPAPKMLLPRDRIFEIGERIGSQGEVIEPLLAEDVAGAARKLVADGVEAVAVCFLFAYANPAHEQARSRPISTYRCRTRSIRNGANTSARRRPWPTPISARRSRATCGRWKSCRAGAFRAPAR
jgi:N-methylhydantoinase A